MSQEPAFHTEVGLEPVRLLRTGSDRWTDLLRDPADGRLFVRRSVRADLPGPERARLLSEGAKVRESRVRWEGEHLVVLRPYVAGRSLAERLATGQSFSVREAIRLAADVLGQLRPLHSAGHAHCDLRPETIVLKEGGTGAAVVLDLGLLEAPSLRRLLRPAAASVVYLAPEQAGLIDRPVDGRADLYSLGIVLYEALVGVCPYDGSAVRDVLHQHLSAPVPRVRSTNAVVPSALDEFVAQLLSKDPEDRPRNAAEALAALHRVALSIHAGDAGGTAVPHTLSEARMAGREQQLTALLRRAEDAGNGIASCVLISAASGGGKTRLLDEFADRVVHRGAWLLRGGGVEGAAQQPLQVLVGVVEGIVAQAGSDPHLRGRLHTALAAHADVLRDVLPMLGPVLPEERTKPSFADARTRWRALSSLSALLAALGTAGRPAVVLLDDCQWADELTVALLTTWCRAARDAEVPAHLTLVMALRPEDVSTDHPLLLESGLERVDLPPLDADEVVEVVTSMAGDVPPEVTSLVNELSRGEPLMVGAVLRGLVEGGALEPTRQGWAFTVPDNGWQASQESAGILGRRISLLDTMTQCVLRAGAVYGRSFTLNAAAHLAGVSLPTAKGALRQAEDRSLVWAAGDDRFTIVHDRLRASLLADVDPRELSRLHLGAAAQIEAEQRGAPGPPGRAFELAHHFDAGGHPERALPYALVAAAAARSQHDLELAERYYRIAEGGLAGSPPATCFEVAQSLGDILMLRGRYDESARRFERARALADSDIAVARIEGRLGGLVFRRDDLEGAAAHLETALELLGERIPRGRVQVVRALARELTRRGARHLRPRGARKVPEPSELDLLRSHLYTQLQYPRWFHSERLETMWLMVRQVNMAERCPGTRELAHAYGVWGGAMALTIPVLWKRGLRHTDASDQISRAHGDMRGRGHAASMRACVLHAAGRYAEAEAAAAAAIQLLEEHGDRWETGFAARNRAVCLYRLGRIEEALEEASRVQRLGVDLGDAHAEVTALEVVAKATDGRVRTAQTQRALLRQGADIEVRTAGLQAEALRLRNDGDLVGAISRLEQAAHIARTARPTNTYLVPALAWLATVRREQAEREIRPWPRWRALWVARRDARRAVRYARLYRNDLPHALRERAVIGALLGNTWGARRRLQRSVYLADARSARGEIARTHAESERLGLAVRVPDESLVTAPAHSGSVDRTDIGLADRFEALLEAGVQLAGADSEGAIVSAVGETVVTLLRADGCQVVGLTSSWNRSNVEPRLAAAVDQLCRLVEPVVLAPANGAAPPELSVLVPSHARSALAAPVVVRGELAGWFVAVHEQVTRHFGADEERLASLIARLAGAALERQRVQHEAKAQVIAAQEAERSRVARDLHDEVGQALTSVLLGVRSIETASTAEERRDRAEQLRRTVTGGLDSVQRLAFALRPAVLDDLGLVAALRRLRDQAQEKLEVEMETVDIEPGDRFESDIETTAYRIVQESLTNVVRHSGASRCSVIAGRNRDRLRIVIEDDGRGFDPGTAMSRFGLRGMRERAELVGATFRVDSAPGLGTSVIFEVPL